VSVSTPEGLAAALADLIDMVSVAIGIPAPAEGAETAYMLCRSNRANTACYVLAQVDSADVETVRHAANRLRELLPGFPVTYPVLRPDDEPADRHGLVRRAMKLLIGKSRAVGDPPST